MTWILVIASGVPLVLAVGLVAGAFIARRDSVRSARDLAVPVSWAPAAAALRSRTRLATALGAAGWVVGVVLQLVPSTFDATSVLPFVLPLVGGVLGVAVLTLPGAAERRARAASGTALDPRRRHAWTFAPVLPLVGAASAGVLLFVTCVVAGATSSVDDETGASTMYTMPLGDATVGTLFFGWHFGVPVLAVGALLAAVAVVALVAVARPARPAVDQAADERLRRTRSRAALRVTAASLALTLGASWDMIAGASTLHTTMPGTEWGTIEITTAFAVLGPALQVAAVTAQGLGLAALVAELLRRRDPVEWAPEPVHRPEHEPA